jgi:hypothetical protein
MKKLLLFCVIAIIALQLKAQNLPSIKGKIVDTTSSALLTDATISLLNVKDSTLVKFTRATENGSFELGNLKKGKFILLITYPKYADFFDQITLDSTKLSIDYGKISLTGKANLLADVIIKGKKAAIKIKGDTTEFDPSAYNIEPNAKVEDLLKQFPGIQVDKDGKITAQGKTVTKVLVDGEEFFGDDPTLVTKNLRADMVSKVQLYDKKSDQASFTGIDDGVKDKTLNIQLKEDMKKGYFGKAIASAGTRDFYAGQLMFNKFSGKKKFSMYGILGNNGTTGLSWRDSEKYSSSSLESSDDGMMYFSSGDDDLDSFDGQYSGQGIPLVRNGGLHFDNKFNNDKESINTNYKIGSIRVKGEGSNLSQNTVSPTNFFNNSSNRIFNNYMLRQKLDVTYEIKLDSTTTLKATIDGTLKRSNTQSDNFSESTRIDNSLLNSSSRLLNNRVDDQSIKANLLLTKKFKKKGRTISINLNQNYNKSISDGYLNSINTFYNETSFIDSVKKVDQNKINNMVGSVFSSNLTYTEPLSKSLSLIVNYGLNLSTGESDRKSFNKDGTGDYNVLDQKFSNNYKLNQTANQIGAFLNYQKGKSVLNFGSKFSNVNFRQLDVYSNNTLNRDFINYMPQLSYTYKFSQFRAFNFRYNGNTNQPSINQIQPVRSNLDELNQTIGNPNLKPSFSNNMSAYFNSYKVISEQYIWLSASYNFSANEIINNSIISSGGQTITQYTNLHNKLPYRIYLNGNIGQKIKAIDINAGFNFNANQNISYNYVNDVLNKTSNGYYFIGLNISRYKNKKYNFSVSVGPSYNSSKTDINNAGNSKGWGWTSNLYSTVQLPKNFEIKTDANFNYTGKTQIFNETNQRFIWNAEFAKMFFKEKNLRVSISANDLLNQNQGFNRSANAGIINQSTYTTIQRYFMFNISWDFNKMGAGVKKSN